MSGIHTSGHRPYPAIKVFTDDGSPTGSGDLTVDGSVTPVEFWVTGADYSSGGHDFPYHGFAVNTVIFHVVDAGGLWTPVEFANLGAALSTGLELEHVHLGHTHAIWNGTKIKDNTELESFSSRFIPYTWAGNDQNCVARWDFKEKFGSPLILGPTDKLLVRVNDNLTGIDTFLVTAQGSWI